MQTFISITFLLQIFSLSRNNKLQNLYVEHSLHTTNTCTEKKAGHAKSSEGILRVCSFLSITFNYTAREVSPLSASSI